MSYLDELRGAVEELHECQATHVESVPVNEVFQGKPVWEGIVEVFELKGHPDAGSCYAWSHPDGVGDSETRFVAILKISPIDSPLKAVRAAALKDLRDSKRPQG